MNIYLIASEDHKVFGVGQTTRSFEERHHDGDWAKFHNYLKARDEELHLIHWWEDVNIVDTDIHKFLKVQPGVRKFAEWFSHSTSLDIIENLIESEFFTDYNDNRVHLTLNPYQKDFVTKAHNDYNEFLLAAKCRAGKSVMVLSHILDKNHKISLVVSRFKSPSHSWLNDSKTFDCFSKFVTISLSDKNWVNQLNHWMNTDNQIILWSTVQGLVRKLDNLPSIDLLVYDEAHIGDKSSQFIKVRNYLSSTPCLKVSGTAYDQLWDTTESNRFIYDYFQEQIDVQSGIVNRPSMEVVLATYDSERYSEIYGEDPDAMRNLFLVDDGKFADDFLVKEFISKFFDTRDIKPKNRLLYKSNHIYMCLPSVEACHLFQSLLNNIIPTKVVTGDTGVDADEINQFVSENNRSVCLTYSANVLGVTQSLWDTVINCREGKSIQFWTQFAFRAGSGNQNWRVIDFVPQRALESLRETFILANDLNPSLSEYEFLDFVPIHEWSGEFKSLTVNDVNRILSADIASTTRLMTGGTDGLNITKLMDIDFNNFIGFDKEITKSVVLNEEGNDNGSAKQRTNEMNPKQKSDLQAKIKTIKSYLALIPQVIFEERLQNNNINTIDDVIQSDNYELITGDDSLLVELLNENILSSKSLSRRVNQTRISIDSSMTNQSPSVILSELEVSTGISQGIPRDLLDKMMVA